VSQSIVAHLAASCVQTSLAGQPSAQSGAERVEKQAAKVRGLLAGRQLWQTAEKDPRKAMEWRIISELKVRFNVIPVYVYIN
jgi:hypothetical protein